jgi:solute carrier family 25 (mitochondrial phosphate transporter), member 23/24/25/41
MPNKEAAATLRAVFTFYSDVVTLTSEGDSVVSDETLESIGMTSSFMHALFGSILRLAMPPDYQRMRQSDHRQSDLALPRAQSGSQQPNPTQEPWTSNEIAQDDAHMDLAESDAHIPTSTRVETVTGSPNSTSDGLEPGTGSHSKDNKHRKLMRSPFDPGYFIAGAVAGGVSRTATAPLDRLKVYLLVNTNNNANLALNAAKNGLPVQAVKQAGRPLLNAISDLYRSGGIRGFFAGTCCGHEMTRLDN